MDELAVAYVDAHVAYALGGAGEEHRVAYLELALVHRDAVGVHRGGGAVYGVAEVLEDVAHEAGAVEAGGAGARPDIGRAEELLGKGDDLLADGTGGGRLARIGLGEGDIVAAYVAGLAAGGDLVPLAVHAEDLDALAVGGDADYLAVGPGRGAHAHVGAVHPALGREVHGLGEAEVVGGHVAALPVVVDLVPAAAGVGLDYEGRALADRGDYRVACPGPCSEVHRRRGLGAADAVGLRTHDERANTQRPCCQRTHFSLSHGNNLTF